MVKKKTGSKRQSMKLKFAINKKVKAHRKKLNKLARDNPNMVKSMY